MHLLPAQFSDSSRNPSDLVPLQADEALGWGGQIGLIFTVTGIMTLFTLWPAA